VTIFVNQFDCFNSHRIDGAIPSKAFFLSAAAAAAAEEEEEEVR
jgi:hypothetical protein